jgi:hypothetical protein
MKIFIGSSSEAAEAGLLGRIATIVQDKGKEPVKWNKTPSLFKGGKSMLQNLEEIPTREHIDASIFICTEDDKTDYRGKEIKTPRDNVIFEHGLFLGKLGAGKSVIIKKGNVTLPNDIDGIVHFDFSDGKDERGESDLKQWLDELEGTKKNKSSQSCVYPEELNCARAKIEQELKNITASGIINVFDNQYYAIKDYGKKTPQNVKILCIRGESFLSDDLWNFSEADIKEAILGDSSNDDMIMGRYEAQKKNDDSPEIFKNRYKKRMIESQGTYPNRVLYIHNETNLPFRMLFVDDYLYLSVFQKNIKASELPVMKIKKNTALYSGCEEYYSKILKNATSLK